MFYLQVCLVLIVVAIVCETFRVFYVFHSWCNHKKICNEKSSTFALSSKNTIVKLPKTWSSRVLSMNPSDSGADSKLYYQKTACKRDFMFFVLSVGDSATIMQIFDMVILLKSRIILQFLMLMQIMCIRCINFLLFWNEGIFLVLMMLFVWYMKLTSTTFCITKKYLVNMTQCLSCFVFDVITHSKCVRSCNSWLLFGNVFWCLCGFWLYVFLSCFCFWIYFVIFVCCVHVHLHITVILVLNKTSWYDKCDD